MNRIIYSLKMLTLSKKTDANNAAYLKEMKNSSKNGNLIEEIRSEYGAEYFILEEQRRRLITGYLLSVAYQLVIPIPSKDQSQYWEEYQNTNSTLSDVGIQFLREQIRRERSEFRNTIGFWVTNIVGILGALIGLAAVIGFKAH